MTRAAALRLPLALALALSLALVAAPRAARAAPPDAAAQKLDAEAMGNDYLNTAFGRAEKKLRRAIDLCGKSSCSPAVTARLHRDLAVLLIVGFGRREEAKAEFAKALGIDPRVTLDPDYTTREVQQIFQSLRVPAGRRARVAGIEHDAPPEARVGTPLPIYAIVEPGTGTKRLRARYRPPGAASYRSVELLPYADGFGGLLPCDATASAGALSYFLQGLDDSGDIVLTLGAPTQPLTVPVKPDLDGDAPHLPDADPPRKCRAGACDGPGCGPAATAAARAGAGPAPLEDNPDWLTVAVEQDFAILAGGTDVCNEGSQVHGSYSCFRRSGSQYVGTPEKGKGGALKGGLGVGTTRVLLGFDRTLTGGLLAGVRAGYVVQGSSPRPDGASAHAFMPWHGELRMTYVFGPNPTTRTGVRGELFAMGGVAQVDSHADLPVKEDKSKAPPPNQLDNPAQQTLTVWVHQGVGFAGAGGGVLAAFTPGFGVFVHVKVFEMFPSAGPAVAPEAGFALGF
ncbi:MAG TPA: hypothetical protein VGM56_12265 [Byssovorax sp.]|jgi:hypothetical protein